jgi:hypothetical protein
MGMTSTIYKSFLRTKRMLDAYQAYPKQGGIYALFLVGDADLGDFGQSGCLIYIGIAKESLQNRDLRQHFRNGLTGSSTLRRSLGAILKNRLQLIAIPRGSGTDSRRFNNYRFSDEGERELTSWMVSNLELGYWVPDRPLTYQQLRKEEERVTIEFRPTLDLDRRTRNNNPFADMLSGLRKICKMEAGQSVTHS